MTNRNLFSRISDPIGAVRRETIKKIEIYLTELGFEPPEPGWAAIYNFVQKAHQ